MKIDWKQKLSSRKFWSALIGFITAILVAFNVDNLTIEQVTTVITAISALIAYMFSESIVDAVRIKNKNEETPVEEGQTNIIGFQHVECDKNED